MSQFLRKIFRNPSPSFRLISTFTNQNRTNLSPPLFINTSFLGQHNFDHGGKNTTLNPNNHEEITHLSKFQIYPSFSVGFFLNPIYSSGSGVIGPEMDQNGMMWADSVKKKRKKKMNKHKYKKLRKRLRRKTKT